MGLPDVREEASDIAIIFDQTPAGASARESLAYAMIEPILVAMLPEWQEIRRRGTPERVDPKMRMDAAMRRAEADRKSKAKVMTAAQDAELVRMMSSFRMGP